MSQVGVGEVLAQFTLRWWGVEGGLAGKARSCNLGLVRGSSFSLCVLGVLDIRKKQRFAARVCLGTEDSRVPMVDIEVWFPHGERDGSQLQQEEPWAWRPTLDWNV